MTEKSLHGLSCPNCAGMIHIPEGQVMVTCPYCNLRSLVKGERGIRRYQVARGVNREKALKATQNFLSGKMQIARNAAKNSEIQETFVAYLPFWAKWGRVLGWVFGQKQVGSGDNKRYEPREIKVMEDMDWNGVALDVGEFGVQSISLKNRSLEAFSPEELHDTGMVFEPVSSQSEAEEIATSDFFNRLRSLAGLDRVSQTFLRIANQRLGLVYYPLWVVRYLYRGRSFQVVVDGHDGKVLYGKAPGSTFFRSIALTGGMALGALLAIDGSALVFYFAIFAADSDDSLGALLVGVGFCLVAGFGLMAAGYRAFRYGEQYEFHGHSKNKRSIRRKSEKGVQRAREIN